MLFVSGILPLQIIEAFYGTFCATEVSFSLILSYKNEHVIKYSKSSSHKVAYYSYIYAKTDKKHFQTVTSHTRAATFLGRFISATTSQLLAFFNLVTYWQLNLITFICESKCLVFIEFLIKKNLIIGQVAAALWSIFCIPSVNTSVYFHRKGDENDKKSAFKLIRQHFASAYTNKTVILWSIFYSVSFGLYFQIFAYIQVLWLEIEDNAIWNATVDALFTVSGAFFALLAGKIQISFLQRETPTFIALIIMSMLKGVIIIVAAYSSTLLQCYAMFVLFGIVYSLTITITATKIAENLNEDSYGLVFGFNTFIALITQTILTLSVVSNGFKFNVEGQYIVYGCIYLILAGLYAIKLVFDLVKTRRKKYEF